MRMESGKADYDAAIVAARKVAEASPGSSVIQAAALMRIARNYRMKGQLEESLQTYSRLSALGATLVDGRPARLQGDVGALRVQKDRKDPAALLGASETLMRDLNSALWPVNKAVYESLSVEARRYLAETETHPAAPAALAEAIQTMWDRWNRGTLANTNNRLSLDTASGPVFVVWRDSGSGDCSLLLEPQPI